MQAPVLVPLAVYLVLLAPVAALLVGFFVVRPLKPQWTHLPILASCAVVAAASLSLAGRAYAGWGIDVPLYAWMGAGDWVVSFGVRVDGIATAMLAMVSVVGGMIHLYSVGYLKGDPGFSRFFLVLHLFFLSMIGMVLANNFVQFYMFWEGVGLTSYLLIGFWSQKAPARRAALQAFLANRVGDAGFLLAILILLNLFGNTRFGLVAAAIAGQDPVPLALAGFLLFWAACAKSAQFPLYFWLPDAMEGPTPASALMHAATMVTAGIYLLIRAWPLLAAVPALLDLMTAVGAATSIAAGILACSQTDLKRILAYSTVSHLGLMVFALGLGHPGSAMFHLLTHGFFKAALFLCVGNIAHALGQSGAKVSEVGGLGPQMPVTFACFTAAALSLAGLWPLAGFFSKDAILDAALHAGAIWGAAAVSISFLGGFYILRMLLLTFVSVPGRPQNPPHVHEADPGLAAPCVFLALGAAGAGWLEHGVFRLLTSGAIPAAEALALPEFSWTAALSGTAAVMAAAVLTYRLFVASPAWDWSWRERLPALTRVFETDFGWRGAVAAMAEAGRRACSWIGLSWDKRVVDGLIESGPGVLAVAARAASASASGLVNDSLWWMLAGASLAAAAVLF